MSIVSNSTSGWKTGRAVESDLYFGCFESRGFCSLLFMFEKEQVRFNDKFKERALS